MSTCRPRLVERWLPCLSVLVLAAGTAPGCGARLPPPPYERAFALEGQAPRVLIAGQEITVPLTIRNTGTRSWVPDRTHVSYHWLWIIPRELAKRSRTVPYQDGIRTELGARVDPGAVRRLEGRLLAPEWPGVYWLQWDMVDEGVTWFAQVAPRQPRRLIVVLPTLGALAAPLPLVLALGAAAALRPRRAGSLIGRASLATGDLVWWIGAAVAKPLVLAHDVLLEPTAGGYALIVAAAVAPPLAAWAIVPRGRRAWLLFATGTLLSLLLLADIVYYRFFGDVLSAAAMAAARQTGRVSSSILSLLSGHMLWLVVDLPCAAWLAVRLQRRGAPEGRAGWLRAAALGAAAAAAIPAYPVAEHGRLDQMFRNRAVMEQLGPIGYHLYDAWIFLRATVAHTPPTEAEIESAQAWFAGRAPLRAGTGPTFGLARGLNLIVIQVESLQDFVVDYRVGDQAVMPHLSRWTTEAVRFTNVTDQTGEGRTSDAELAALASLLPLDHGAAAFRYAGDHYVGLPRILAEHGYATLSAVPFEAGFWNRRVMHPAYGFARSLFEPDFELTEQIGWGLDDQDFLQQMVPHLVGLPRPFAAWLITLSLHHPFDDFPDRHKVLALGSLEHTAFGNYLHTMHFFDASLAAFEEALARAGLLEQTVLVVFGDHDAGFARGPSLARTIGVGADEASWTVNDRVPLFIRLPARLPLRPTGVRSLPAGQTDIAPTLLALVGIDPAPLPYVGRNLLGAPGDGPLVRPYGEWLDASRLWLGAGAAGGGCYVLAAHAFADPSACAEPGQAARRAHDVAQFVLTNGLQQRLRERLQVGRR